MLSGKTCLLSHSKDTISASHSVQYIILMYLTLTVMAVSKQDFRYAKTHVAKGLEI